MEFDELKAVEFINTSLKQHGRSPYDEDEVLNVIDIEAEPDEDADDVESEVVDYVTRMLKKDKHAVISAEDVPLMVKAEMEYEDSVI